MWPLNSRRPVTWLSVSKTLGLTPPQADSFVLRPSGFLQMLVNNLLSLPQIKQPRRILHELEKLIF